VVGGGGGDGAQKLEYSRLRMIQVGTAQLLAGNNNNAEVGFRSHASISDNIATHQTFQVEPTKQVINQRSGSET